MIKRKKKEIERKKLSFSSCVSHAKIMYFQGHGPRKTHEKTCSVIFFYSFSNRAQSFVYLLIIYFFCCQVMTMMDASLYHEGKSSPPNQPGFNAELDKEWRMSLWPIISEGSANHVLVTCLPTTNPKLCSFCLTIFFVDEQWFWL